MSTLADACDGYTHVPDHRTCSDCGDTFDIEREGDEIRGESYCDNCRDDHQETCGFCEEHYPELDYDDDKGRIVVTGKIEGSGGKNIAPGWYRIVKWPFYRSDMLGDASLFADRLQFVAPLRPDDEGKDEEGYPSMLVCEDCMQDRERELVDPLYCRRRCGKRHPRTVQCSTKYRRRASRPLAWLAERELAARAAGEVDRG